MKLEQIGKMGASIQKMLPFLQRKDLKSKFETPEWFDERLFRMFVYKVDRSDIDPPGRLLDWTMRQAAKSIPDELGIITKKHTWEDLENMTAILCREIKEGDFQPDKIIGIKTGGAIYANCFAKYLGFEEINPELHIYNNVHYIRTAHYSSNTRSVVTSIQHINETATITEPLDVKISGKKILLVDDQTESGSSFAVGKQHLLDLGAEEVRTVCYFKRKKHDNLVPIDYFIKRGLAIYFPHGKDA